MALKRAIAGTFATALALLPWASSCRSLSLCGEPNGCARSSATGGAAGGPGGEGSGAGQGGDDQGASRGGAAGEEGATGSTCLLPLADCDNSTLTGCETDVRWNASHCGACGQPCKGICAGAVCHPGELLLEIGALDAIVSTETHAYTIISDLNGEASLLSIERTSGSREVMLQLPTADVTLHRGMDRLYLCDGETGNVSSIGFAGTSLAPEAFSADEMGTSRDGVYYALSDELWFRSNAAGAEPVLVEELSGSFWDILGDGNSLVVEAASEQGAVFYLMRGAEPVLLGPRPEPYIAFQPMGDGLVVVTHRTDDPWMKELFWLSPGQPALRYRPEDEIETVNAIGRLDGNALLELRRGPTEFVLLLGRDLETSRLGIPPDSSFVHIDTTHVWYLDHGTDLVPKLMRATFY